jgi:hypothetical protein
MFIAMRSFLLFSAALLGIFYMSLAKEPAQPASGRRTPVLVELFTSEGCSSCPPGDKLLIELKEKQTVLNAEVIAMGQHVDYWNRDGWTDRFSSAQFTARQEQYAERLNDGPYTPQVVVDGTTSVVGNDVEAVGRAIRKAAAEAKPLQLELSESNGQVQISVHGILDSSPEIFFALVEDDLESQIKAGENRGVTLHHGAVARQLRSLGNATKDGWKTAVPIQLASGQRKERTQALVFAQDSRGKVLGVNKLPLQ